MNRISVRLRVLLLAFAAMLGLTLGMPSQAHAASTSAQSSVGAVALSKAPDHGSDCYKYNYKHDRYYYYRYCYDWKYKNKNDEKNKKRWFYKFDLYYYYYDKGGHKKYGDCYYKYDSYKHSDSPYRRYCSGK